MRSPIPTADVEGPVHVPRRVPHAQRNGNGVSPAPVLINQSPVQASVKRAFDIGVSTILLLLLSPVMAAIGLLVKLDSEGPILFGQTRLGLNGRRFTCLKFRTMQPGTHRALLDDPELRRRYVENDYKLPPEAAMRITRVGRVLRRSGLDELPQLFNVVAGSMSLVGPRPIVPAELAWYGQHARLFLSVRPGITGVWQVVGRSRIRYPERARMELEAITRMSFGRDLRLLLKTVPAVVRRS